ncbi:mycofactocin-coupled SDR family oxidoreductase [Nocardia takedensis]
MVRPMPSRCRGEHRRAAVVTGAGRGIGAATVLALASRGWSVLAVDSAENDAALPYPLASAGELAAVTNRAGSLVNRVGAVRSFVADVRDPDALRAAVDTAVRAWGGLDAAIAAAGVLAGGVPLWEMSPEAERAVLDVCLGGVAQLARAAVPALLGRPAPRTGRFLAVSAASTLDGVPLFAAYGAANAGVAGLIRSLNAELSGTGVTANAVSPGATATDLLAEGVRLSGGADPVRQSLIGSPSALAPEQVATVLAFLAGPDSGAIAGAVVEAKGDAAAPVRPMAVERAG